MNGILKNYLKVTWANITGHWLVSSINVFGLGIGITCCLLILLYVRHELSFDAFYADSDRIYRVSRDFYPEDARGLRVDGRHPASINGPFGPMLKQDFPEIEASARFYGWEQTIWRDNTPQLEQGFMFADAPATEIFSYVWRQGNSQTALIEPLSVVLTESVAKRYFSDSDPMGKTLRFGNGGSDLTVTGVIADLPDNTHLPINALISITTIDELLREQIMGQWNGNTDFHTYIKLAPRAAIEQLESQFPAFLNRYAGENSGETTGITAMNIADIHLHSQRSEEITAPGSLQQVYALTLIALGVLIIACINFMNLSTAYSSKRGLEIGMRKAMGAKKQQLVYQFLGESMIMVLIAMTAALVLVELLLPWFESFTGKTLSFGYLREIGNILLLLFLLITVGLVAGSYPAFYLSSFRPAGTLRGAGVKSQGGVRLRQLLVVVQFAIAIVLVVATIVIQSQLQFAREFELGVERDNVVVISGNRMEGLGEQWKTMKSRLLSHPQIESVTSSHYTPFSHDENFIPVSTSRDNLGDTHAIKYMAVDYNFFHTYGINLLAGRTFSEERGTDRMRIPNRENPNIQATGSFIINEQVARELGWSAEQAIGKFLWMGTSSPVSIPIIGVTHDSYFESLSIPIEPLIFFIPPPGFRGMPSLPKGGIKVTGINMQETLGFIDDVWKEFLPHIPSQRHFLNDDFELLYNTERTQGAMLSGFSLVAICIACLGLFGLAAFNAERRTKEIGIRKVMGSGVWRIVMLLTNDFSKLVLLSNLIAWPIAYIAMSRWLEQFAYRIDLTPLIFIGSGLIALCIAWVTVGGTAAKAASQKPVLALRYE